MIVCRVMEGHARRTPSDDHYDNIVAYRDELKDSADVD